MEFIPFLAFSHREQDAIVRALRRAGIAPGRVCVSRLEVQDAPAARDWEALTTVSTPRWARTYGSAPGADWLAASDRTGLDRVFLAAPSSTDARLRQAVDASRGFVYAVSTMGITGARSDVDAAARTLVGRLRDAGATSTCVGLGISSAAQVAEVLEYADGAIVGSALVKALGDGGVAEAGRVAAELAGGTAA